MKNPTMLTRHARRTAGGVHERDGGHSDQLFLALRYWKISVSNTGTATSRGLNGAHAGAQLP